jgi:excisionase family DNA binding protein
MQKNGNGGGRRNSQHRTGGRNHPKDVSLATAPSPKLKTRTPEKPLLTVPDVANWFQVSEAQVYDLLHRGAIPAERVGREWRFSRDKLERWVLDAI